MRLLRPLVVGLLLASCAAEPALVDRADDGGFALYRSGRLGRSQLRQLCEAGVEEIVVMDGTGQARECVLRDQACPGLRVRYDGVQDPRSPVSRDFLDAFATWIEESRLEGRKIVIRCRHGWHRTGRMSAYYRMRFQDWSLAAAESEMLQAGEWMWRYPELRTQLAAFAALLETGDCSSSTMSCPPIGRSPAESFAEEYSGAVFLRDVCSD